MLRFMVAIPPTRKLYKFPTSPRIRHVWFVMPSENPRSFSIAVYPHPSSPDVVRRPRRRAHSTGCPMVGFAKLSIEAPAHQVFRSPVPLPPHRPRMFPCLRLPERTLPALTFVSRQSRSCACSALPTKQLTRPVRYKSWFSIKQDWESWRLMGVSTQRAWLVVMRLLLRASQENRRINLFH